MGISATFTGCMTCANNFFEELPATETIEQVDSGYHRVITTSGEYCGFCYGTFKETTSTLERHHNGEQHPPGVGP